MFQLLIKNAKQLVTVCDKGELVKSGKAQSNVSIIENGSVVVGKEGKIIDLGKATLIAEKYEESQFEKVIDATGKSVIPGFVDAHTHPVWAGDRCHEFAMKIEGASYMEIHAKGGGIGYTVKHTREASEEQLLELLMQRLKKMQKNGTTTVEAKSGYGLNTNTEIKMLKVIERAQQKCKDSLDIVATYLGAHSYPKDMEKEAYVKQLLEEQIPKIVELKKQNVINPSIIDVFLEKGVFDFDTSRDILKKGKEHGFLVNFHGDELHPMEAGKLAYEVDALGVSHLEQISEEGIELMAKKQIVGVLLPTTAYILRIEYPPARKMIENNVPIALATDYNPNAHCLSLPFVLNISAVNMRMTMEECLVAATINAAASLGISKTHGSIEKGKMGDFVIVNHEDWRHVIYELVDPPIDVVIKRGRVIHSQ